MFNLIAQLYQGDLAKIGVTLNIKQMDLAAWLDQANNRKYHGFWGSTMLVLLGAPSSAFSNGRGTDPNSNNEGFKNDRYAELINLAASEPDVSKRKTYYSELNDIVLDQSFIMPICPSPTTLVTTSKVHDVNIPTADRVDDFAFTDAWMES